MSCTDSEATHHTGCPCWEAKRDAREKHLEDLLKKALTHIGRFGWSDVWLQEVNQTITEIRHAIYETHQYREYKEQHAELEVLRRKAVDLKVRLTELSAVKEIELMRWRELAKLECVCAGYEGPDCVSCKARKALENK